MATTFSRARISSTKKEDDLRILREKVKKAKKETDLQEAVVHRITTGEMYEGL